MRFIERLHRLEARRAPAAGALPMVVIVPDADPERAQVLADVQRRRARGENVLAVGEADDVLAVLVESFAP